jgi:low temperature requirement protein LtrA
VVSLAAEHKLLAAKGEARVKMAIVAYIYGHFPIVAGVVLAALGVEGVLAHAGDRESLGGFFAGALFGGFAVYLTGHLLFKHRMHNSVSVPRLVAVGAPLVALPAAAFVPPLFALTFVVLILAALVGFETNRYGLVRRSLRQV